MDLNTKIELDISSFSASAGSAAKDLQQVTDDLGKLQSDLSSSKSALSVSSAAFDVMNNALKASAADSARAAAGMVDLANKTDKAGTNASIAGGKFRAMIGVTAGLSGIALTVVDPMLRASGHGKAADYTSGITKGVLGGAAAALPTLNPYLIAGSAVVGGASAAFATSSKRGAEQAKAAKEEAEALNQVSLASAAALRGIQALDQTSQAESALDSLRESLTKLEQEMTLGLATGPVAERQQHRLGVQIGAAEARLGELRAGDRQKQIGESGAALADYGRDRGAADAQASFAGQIEAAKTAAEKQELVNARLTEFAGKADALRQSLADVAVQADETRFNDLLDQLKGVDAESDRLRSMRIAEEKPREKQDRSAPILTDALTRIGGGSGNMQPMNAVERNTSNMARILTSVDRHLAKIAGREITGGAAWA